MRGHCRDEPSALGLRRLRGDESASCSRGTSWLERRHCHELKRQLSQGASNINQQQADFDAFSSKQIEAKPSQLGPPVAGEPLRNGRTIILIMGTRRRRCNKLIYPPPPGAARRPAATPTHKAEGEKEEEEEEVKSVQTSCHGREAERTTTGRNESPISASQIEPAQRWRPGRKRKTRPSECLLLFSKENVIPPPPKPGRVSEEARRPPKQVAADCYLGQFNYHFTQLAALLMLVLSLAACTNQPAQAYQLTNNLIANNLPPKFATTSSSASGPSGGGGGGGGGSSAGSNSEIVVRVKEGHQSIGKLIYTLRGEDPDEDPLTFGLLGSMASDLLRIENVPGNQANVYLRKELDRETTESHQVVITLTDGKLGRGNWVSACQVVFCCHCLCSKQRESPH